MANHSRESPKDSFSITGVWCRCKERLYSFPWIAPITLYPYLIMLSIKRGSIKYHFLSLWYDSTWDWTLVSWAIGEGKSIEATLQFFKIHIKWDIFLSFFKVNLLLILSLSPGFFLCFSLSTVFVTNFTLHLEKSSTSLQFVFERSRLWIKFQFLPLPQCLSVLILLFWANCISMKKTNEKKNHENTVAMVQSFFFFRVWYVRPKSVFQAKTFVSGELIFRICINL